jgi:hypothetical protein
VYEGFESYTYDKKIKQFLSSKGTPAPAEGKKRFFVSLMSESLIKKGVFFRLRKRTRVRIERSLKCVCKEHHYAY